MADEENAQVNENAEEEVVDVTEPKDKTRSLVLIMIILSVLMMILTPTITIIVIKHMLPKSEKDVETKIYPCEFSIKAIQVNLADEGSSRFAQVDIVMKLSTDKLLPYFEPYSSENKKGLGNDIRSLINMRISSRTVNKLSSPENKQDLADDIKDQLNQLISNNIDDDDLIDPTVKNIIFPKFVIQ